MDPELVERFTAIDVTQLRARELSIQISDEAREILYAAPADLDGKPTMMCGYCGAKLADKKHYYFTCELPMGLGSAVRSALLLTNALSAKQFSRTK